MIKLEDILEDALRYLRREMDNEERAFFEELLDRYPHLWEEMRMMELAGRRLREMETAPALRRQRKRVWILGVFLLLASLLLVWLFYPRAQPEAIPPARQAGEDRPQTFFKIEQGGGASADADADRGFSVKWTHGGDLIFAGMFEGTGRLGDQQIVGRGAWDILLGRYDLDNGFQWIRTFGSPAFRDMARAMALDGEDNLLITGSFGDRTQFGDRTARTTGVDQWGDHDLFVAKLDPEGRLLWLDHGGGVQIPHRQTGVNQGMAVAVDADDNVVFSASYVNESVLSGVSLPAGGPVEDLVIAKYDPEGRNQWVKTITGDYMIIGMGLATDPEQNIYLTGAFGHHNFSGRAYFPGVTLTSYGGRDIFLAKFAPDGQMRWVRQAGSPVSEQGHEMAACLAVDPLGNSIIAGLFQGAATFGPGASLTSYGGHDIFLAKYDTDGRLLWVRQAGGPEGSGGRNEHAQAVAVNRTGDIFVTGAFSGTARFGPHTLRTGESSNFFLAKYGPDGTPQWALQFEALDGFRTAAGIGIDINPANGTLAVTGLFSGRARVGDRTMQSEGGGDIFLLLFNEEGELLSAKSVAGYVL